MPQVEELAGQYRCLTFDNRGMGASQPIGTRLTVEQMAEDARVLVDAAGWQNAHVVGHSLGGLIALHLALTAPQQVRSLSLLCTFARGREVTRPTPWMVWTGLRSRVGTRRSRRRAFLEMVVTPQELAHADRDELGRRLAPIFGHDLADQPPIVMKQLSAMGAYDATPRLAELRRVPTLVVSAARDRIAPPRLGRALAAGIPGSRYVEIPEAAHGVPIADPARVNALLRAHLAAVDTRRSQKR
jgi:pimeloyl-ACP methyl ester carboxylesterase